MALGPFVIALPRLFLLLGLAAVLATAHFFERRGGPGVEKPLWWSLLAGLATARLSYVLSHLADFRAAPWQALYFWQDGYEPLVGVLGAAALAIWLVARRAYPARRLAVPLLAGLIVWGGLGWLHQALQRGLDKPLPELPVATLAGEPVSLADFKGRPVVMNLWATWCPPCRREMPTLAEAQRAHPDTQFLFVNQAEGAALIRQYLSAERLELRNVLLDSHGRAGAHFDAPGLPTTLFFNADGQLVDTHLGEVSRARLGDYLRKLETP